MSGDGGDLDDMGDDMQSGMAQAAEEAEAEGIGGAATVIMAEATSPGSNFVGRLNVIVRDDGLPMKELSRAASLRIAQGLPASSAVELARSELWAPARARLICLRLRPQ